jgi:phosphohistidine phosphatase
MSTGHPELITNEEGENPMELYLVQHGQAASKEENPDRPLTTQGQADVETVAAFVARHAGMDLSVIYHSGKLRASQTAEAFAEHLQPDAVEAVDGLGPKDDPKIWGDRIAERKDGIMLVGHLPHLSTLASMLLCGNSGTVCVDFRNGGVVHLVRDDDSRDWAVRWIITPDVIS